MAIVHPRTSSVPKGTTNYDIHKKTKVSWALTFSLQGKWNRSGHVARHNDDRCTIRTVTWSGVRGPRVRGRPCERWVHEPVAITCRRWLLIATNGDQWNAFEEGVHAKITILHYDA
ncbi:jg14239 [Pararge aegeria aegeria]|uniref:Jg14239 protein n=1 Tax=Pararge aegeria aegeria TaxID=348720 RepID=A0A8S4RYK5_9NEOP|nr:jg14239 [Pararge aegeria aegeria]